GAVADDLGHIVRPGVNETRPSSRIRAVADGGQTVDGDIRQLLSIPFGSWKNERVVQAGRASAATRSTTGVRVDRAQPIGVGREGELIDEGRRQSADHAQRSRAVWPRPEGRPQCAFERAVEPPGNQSAAQADTMLIAEKVVELHRVLPQVRVAREGPDPVRGTLLEAGRRRWIRIEQSLTVAADPAGRD